MGRLKMDILMDVPLQLLGQVLDFTHPHAGASNTLLINLATSAICIVIALVPFGLYKEALGKERWVLYFGSAFLTLGIQYAVLAMLLVMAQSPSLDFFANSVMSGVNNLLFLAAARELLARTRPFPAWAWILAVMTWIGGLVHLSSDVATQSSAAVTHLHRLPDTIFSVVTVLTLGWSMFSNIDPQWGQKPWRLIHQRSRLLEWRKRFLAWTTLLIACVYALVLAVNGFFDELTSLVAPYTSILNQDEMAKTLRFLISAITFPLKFGLFSSAFYLIVRSLFVLSPRAFHRTLDEVAEATKIHFLSSEGIVETIARSLNADSVQLYFRLPGHSRRRKGLSCWAWSKVDDKAHPWPAIQCKPPDASTIPGWVLDRGTLYKSSASNSVQEQILSWWEPAEHLAVEKGISLPPIQSAIAVPIRYHGKTIAGLSIGWKARRPITAITLQRIRMIATMLIPTLEARRGLLAVSQLGQYFQRQEIVSPDIERYAALTRMTQVVHSTLSPLVTGVSIDVGFTTAYTVCTKGQDEPEGKELTQENSSKRCLERCREALRGWKTRVIDDPEKVSDFQQEELTVEDVVVGSLYLAQPHPSEPESPSLAGDWLLESTVATMLSDALFDATRVRLWAILDGLQVELGSGAPLTKGTWFHKVETAASKAGIQWIVFEDQSAKAPSWRGPQDHPECIEVVRNLKDLTTWVAHQDEPSHPSAVWQDLPTPTPSDQPEKVGHFRFLEPQEGAHHVVRLTTTPRSNLYLGIGRPGFGKELRKDWPWRIFLERFAIAAGASLDRMKLEQIRLDTKHDQGLITASVVTGTLVHQLGNMATNLGFGIENLAAGLNDPAGKPSQGSSVPNQGALDRIRKLQQEVDNLQEVTSNINSATSLDAETPSSLLKATRKAVGLYQLAADEQNIAIQMEVPDDIMVGIPFYVPYQALANLINNSIQAIAKLKATPRDGRIRVVAKDLGGLIYCSVVDSGPGIPPEDFKAIFELKYSTKKKAGGLGLYLARRALREVGGDLVLVESRPGKTEFRMNLPKQWTGDS